MLRILNLMGGFSVLHGGCNNPFSITVLSQGRLRSLFVEGLPRYGGKSEVAGLADSASFVLRR